MLRPVVHCWFCATKFIGNGFDKRMHGESGREGMSKLEAHVNFFFENRLQAIGAQALSDAKLTPWPRTVYQNIQ